MKKRIFAAVLAACALLFSVPFISGCSAGVKYELNEDGASYTISVKGFIGAFKGEFEIPETYSAGEGEPEYPVTAVADKGFSGTRITKIMVPASIKELGVGAFFSCDNLKEVVFAEESQIENIYNGTFLNCRALETINLPQTVKLIYPQAFSGCTALKSIELPQNIERIGYMAFHNSGLEEIEIPERVVDVEKPDLDENGEQKKDDSGHLLTVTEYGLGYAAFHTCVKMKKAVVKAKIETLRNGVFGYCTALEDIYLPETLKEIEGALMYNGSLFCGHPFHHDKSLKNIYFAGTEEQWKAVKIDNNKVVDKYNEPYDNSAVEKAEKHFEAQF